MGEVLNKIPKYMRPIEIKSTEKSSSTFKTLMISFDDLKLGYIKLSPKYFNYYLESQLLIQI